MALAQGISGWIDSGTTQTSEDAQGNPIQIPIMTAVYSGEWQYTNAAGGKSVVAESTATQAQAEAARDSWLSAGGTV